MSAALNLKRLDIYLDFHRPLNQAELLKCREVLRRRALGEPIAYIQGSVDFYHCKIKVSKDTLIPRPETELLVDKVVRIAEKCGQKKMRILDLCTGSGCIAIAIKKRLKDCIVFASDISLQALAVAKQNALENEVEICFLQGDFLDDFSETVDFIICNPPYISEMEFLELDKSVADFEPRTALVGGNTGYEYYERFSRNAPLILTPGAHIALEIGWTQGAYLSKLFTSGPWKDIQIEQDWSKKDRFLFAKYSPMG